MNINFLTAKSDKILFKTEKISISTLSQTLASSLSFGLQTEAEGNDV